MKDAKLLIKHFYSPVLVIYILTGALALLVIIVQCQEPIHNSRLLMRIMGVILFAVIGVRGTNQYTRYRKKKTHFKKPPPPLRKIIIKK